MTPDPTPAGLADRIEAGVYDAVGTAGRIFRLSDADRRTIVAALRRASGPSPEAAEDIATLTRQLDEARAALTEQLHWHETQDKVLSKSGRKDADYHWMRGQHQNQMDALRALAAAADTGERSDG